jgi:hypothetical protein
MRRSITSFIIGLVGGLILLVSSCATVPTRPLDQGEVRLLRIDIPFGGDIRRNIPFPVNIIFEADSEPEIRTACFYWSGEGPKCNKVQDVRYGSPGIIYVDIRAPGPGTYVLETFILYIREGKTRRTETISSSIIVP